MFKKIVATVISCAILCTCFSCGSIKYVKKGEVTSLEGKKVIKVQKLNGEVIELKDKTWSVRGYSVTSSYIKRSEIELNNENDSSINHIEGGVIEIHTTYGEKYRVQGYRETEDQIVISQQEEIPVQIPFEDIAIIYIRDYGRGVRKGLGWGILTGAVSGSLVLIVVAGTGGADLGIIFFPIFSTAFLGLTGMLVWGAKGSVQKVIINPSSN